MTPLMTTGEYFRSIRDRLSPIYGTGEAKAMARLIFHSLKGWDATGIIIHEGDEISEYTAGKIEDIITRTLAYEPIQYILGEARFYGMNLKVDPSTLIPRQETEELVDLIVKKNGTRTDLRILDIGTGSGAIAIALARNLPFSDIVALDMSSEALKVAKENARNLKAKISFLQDDVFRYQPFPGSFDIIVSNPPYIDESEKTEMERNVLDYEPHSALFVPDDDPLIFYSRITEIASEALVKGGALYFEINPRHCRELTNLLQNDGFIDIEIYKDIHGRERFISASAE